MVWQYLLGIAAAYLAWLLVAVILKKLLKLNICAICAAVSSTWLVLLLLYYRNYKVDPLVVAVLMGQSVTGLMYAYEKFVIRKSLKNLLAFRIFFPLVGVLVIYALLTKQISFEAYAVALAILASVIVMAIAVFVFGKFNRQIRSLVKKLEECCG